MKKITCGICLELYLKYFKWFNTDITQRIFKAYRNK